jgi:hypothetical protein
MDVYKVLRCYGSYIVYIIGSLSLSQETVKHSFDLVSNY